MESHEKRDGQKGHGLQTPTETVSGPKLVAARTIGIGALLDDDEEADMDEDAATEPADVVSLEGRGFAPPSIEQRPAGWAMARGGVASKMRAALFDEVELAGEQHFVDTFMEDVEEREMLDVEDEYLKRFESSVREEDIVPEAGDFGGEISRRERLFPRSDLPFLELDKSVVRGKEGYVMDLGLMLGRSTRASFSMQGVMAMPRLWCRMGDPFFRQSFDVDVRDIYHGGDAVMRRMLSLMLRLHCTAWHTALVEVGEEGVEGNVRVPNLKTVFAQEATVGDDVLTALIEQFKDHFNEGDYNALHAHVAFWMVRALYMKNTSYDDEDNLSKRISDWAAGPAGRDFDHESNRDGSGLRGAFINLSLGKIEEAVSMATEAGNLRLALLIARALESPKDDLCADAEAQLASYELNPKFEEENMEDSEKISEEKWDSILENCKDSATVSLNERLILLTLAGHVSSVARFLGLSWYRLFIMEFFHGAGSSQPTQAERVSAAVQAISQSGIPTDPPHSFGGYNDIVYHLLRLYADPTASYPLTTGVYANGSFGSFYSPLDARFSWLMYQVLSGIIPEASTPRAPVILADEFATQLCADGLHLWSFYVRCTGGVPPQVLKCELIRDWPNIATDFLEWESTGPKANGEDAADAAENTMTGERRVDFGPHFKLEDLATQFQPETFLIGVLNVPPEWIAEAKAVAAHDAGEYMKECEYWIAVGSEEGASSAHEILTETVFPEMIALQDVSQFSLIADMLRELSRRKHVAHWSVAGGLILDYLEFAVGVPKVAKQPLEVYRGMVHRVKAMSSRATTSLQHNAASVIADGIAAAERAQLFDATPEARKDILEQVVEDLDELPCSRAVKLRITGEYKIEAELGQAAALRFSAAYPPYTPYLDTRAQPSS